MEQEKIIQEPKGEPLKAIEKLLAEQSFAIDKEEKARMLEQIGKNYRYISVLGVHGEEGAGVKRFLKIPIRKPEEIDELFVRQVQVGKLLKSKGIDTPGMVTENLDPDKGLQFAILETYEEEGDEIGFISQFSPERMKLLTPEIAQECIEVLSRLHEVDVNAMSEAEVDAFRSFSGKTDEFFDLIVHEDLDKRVSALETRGEAVDYGTILDRRLGVTGFHKKVLELLAAFGEVIKREEKKEKVLFHGDFSPDNLHFGKKSIGLLDLEWAGIHDNEAIAMIIDYGNLRARVWNNNEFREALDQAVIDKYTKKGNRKLGEAVVALGILRSDVQIGGFFENYPREKQGLAEERLRREGTMRDLVKALDLAGMTLDTDQEKADFVPAEGHRELLAKMERSGLVKGELLKFDLGENSEHLTVYNPSPMVIDGVTYLWARVEDRLKETGSKAMLFKEDDDKVWHVVEGAPVFGDLQDPFYCGVIDGKHVMGGVQVYEDPGSENLGYRTVFYSFDKSFTELTRDGENIEPFAVGPEKMKGIRLIQLGEGRIGVLTRPQGDFGGRGKMGYIEIESLDELGEALNDFDKIKDPSTFIYGLFIDPEWGGPNQLHLMPDGRIGVVGHIAGFGDDKYITAEGRVEAKKDYYPIWFIFDSNTKTVSEVRILANTDQFPAVEAKQDQFGKILYSGGVVSRDDGRSWLYVGIGDAAAGRVLIRDPIEMAGKIEA